MQLQTKATILEKEKNENTHNLKMKNSSEIEKLQEILNAKET